MIVKMEQALRIFCVICLTIFTAYVCLESTCRTIEEF